MVWPDARTYSCHFQFDRLKTLDKINCKFVFFATLIRCRFLAPGTQRLAACSWSPANTGDMKSIVANSKKLQNNLVRPDWVVPTTRVSRILVSYLLCRVWKSTRLHSSSDIFPAPSQLYIAFISSTPIYFVIVVSKHRVPNVRKHRLCFVWNFRKLQVTVGQRRCNNG